MAGILLAKKVAEALQAPSGERVEEQGLKMGRHGDSNGKKKEKKTQKRKGKGEEQRKSREE